MLRRLPLIIAFGFASLPTLASVADDSPVDFARDISPILSDACFACHGPDESHREAGLRFDLPDSDAIVPGNPDASEMLVRMLSADPETVMPPPHTGKPLKHESIELFRRWIAQGAAYADHWAFTPPVKPPLPDVTGVDANLMDIAAVNIAAVDIAAVDIAAVDIAAWRSGPIDAFVLDRLARERVAPSPQADRATLLRRLHLDLTGLPPTPADVRRFIADDSPGAYENEVQRLLDSVHFGERWGRVWLDAARYADSDGFEKDKPRFVWFYRDWVVRAINADMPYNDFITKQIAGDLLPGATQDDRVATGFLRNSMINEEGGVDPEQFRMEAMFDRMDAIGKSILGLTIQCAQCHSHKYDPISHEDYYGLFAFINNCHEASATVFTPEEETARRATLGRVDETIANRLAADGDWLARLQAWESEVTGAPVSDWTPITLAFDAETIGGQKFLPQDDASYVAAGYAPTKFHPTADAVVDSLGRITAVRVEMMVDPNLPHGGPGRSVDGTWALSEIELLVSKKDESGNDQWQKVAFAGATATIDLPPSPLGARYYDKSDAVRTLGPANFAIDGDYNTAWHGDRGPGRRNDPQTAMFVLAEPIEAETVTDENGETSARPIRFRVKLVQNHGGWNSDDNQTINLGRFRVSVTSDDVPAIPAQPPRVMATIQKPIDGRDEAESRRVIDAFIRQDGALGDLAAAIDEAWASHPAGTSQLVLAERSVPRETYRLERGDFLSPQERIAPAIPSLLNPPRPGEPAADVESAGSPTRLEFARWLASPRNPTTARSIVNRIWQEYFGTGIAATSDDLGLQGEPPSHPELLDFLAADLVENGWSLKSLHRRIVLSETYRQDSTITPDRLETDPQNRLLSRGPRVRVPAEMVRDIALAASGLINREVGGPPVYPPAPDFLFKPPASYGPKTWATSEGADRYRRSLYTFRFRSVPYPVLEAFDAPNGDVSCVRRSVSNTPLQALVTLNEPMFLECAKALADTAISKAAESDGHDDTAITSVFVSCTGRTPNEKEMGVLRDLLAQQRERFTQSPAIARQLSGIAPEAGDATEKAAWTVLARVVMNLDETITKP